MGHFTVAVITKTKNFKEVKKMLAPYDKNLEVDLYISETKEEVLNNAKKCLDRLKKSDKKDISMWGKNILNSYDNESLLKAYIDDDGKIYDGKGNLLTNYNPKAKWDWYMLGGRWDGSLPTEFANDNVSKIKQINFNKNEETYRTYAILNEDGWFEKGEISYFGIINITPKSTLKYFNYFDEYVKKEENQEKYIWLIDCRL